MSAAVPVTPQMREHPIPFSGTMVRAILEGRKTQTRRIVRWPAWAESERDWPALVEHRGLAYYVDGRARKRFACPYGAPGDRLWVRETFQPFFADGFIYLADAGTGRLNAHNETEAKKAWPGWKPSIHMPRRASRLLLEVVEVRVQRLQEITEDDAKAEGVCATCTECGQTEAEDDNSDAHWICEDGKAENELPRFTYRHGYSVAWDGINGKRAPWASNPWVWAITFRRLA